MQGAVIFDPLLGWPVLGGAGGLAFVLLNYAVWRGLGGWWLRALAAVDMSKNSKNSIVLRLANRFRLQMSSR